MLRFLALAPLMAVLALGNAYAGGEKKEEGEKPPPKKGKKEFKFDPKEFFNKLDTNDDGKISKEEFLNAKGPKDKGDDSEKAKAFQEKMFAQIDDDNDGFITAAEWQKFGEEMKAKFGKKKKGPPDGDDKEKKDKD